jgi:hypothetical protein
MFVDHPEIAVRLPDRSDKKTTSLVKQIQQGSPLLWQVGLLFIGLCVLFAGFMLVDTRQLLGINIWVKPFKFAASISIYLFTFSWFLFFSDQSLARKRKMARLTAVCMLVEMVVIAGQAYRGQRSHFNDSTWMDFSLFGVMGLFILINTILVIRLATCFFRQPAIGQYPASFLWSLRWGLLIFLFACLVGGLMSGLQTHTIGSADGGPGLPVVNWSTRAGDLRIAHFLGMHALQFLPLWVWWRSKKTKSPSVRLVHLVALSYLGVCLVLFLLALAGMPLVSLKTD